ncbi:hypothetical protein yaldo0001_21940 [Yersinia aldovae ATCC 35236]|uniref:Uncharacterized protein n=2 Tax=Yersinia aldovae TaxID=29483 RepID=A0A0T9U8X3_YERAL|nr:hypothetical protein [Yersinia aldovae]EEP94367.1 hypothetical protein yaldo0001_21940 [Yersinia aldovae ATCC 35236]CNK38910.1 Uncharacterised protein [Yersinia aldovae]CNL26504.1 Uncharacterised protein [Yersinia aldovae]
MTHRILPAVNIFSNIKRLSNNFSETKLSKIKQPQQTDFNCFEEKKLDNIISELERVFNYNDDYGKNSSIYMQLWDEINKSENHRNHVLWEAQANKGKRSDALCVFLVDLSRLRVEESILYKPEKEKVKDIRRTELCEEVLRKFVARGVQAEIDAIADMKINSPHWNGNEELKKQESTLSLVSYILGLTTNKKDGAKDRLGMGPIASVIGDVVNNARSFLKLHIHSNQPNIDVLHRITDSYYRCYCEKEKLPNEQLIDNVIKEVRASVSRSNFASAKGLPSSIDPESSAYRMISKTILDPAISVMYQRQMTSKILSNVHRENNGEKKKTTVEIQKEYLATDETLDLKSSQIYKDVKNYLLSINENLTEDDISSCAKNYYEFFREKYFLDVHSLVQLEPFQSVNGIQNKRNGIIFDR